MFAGIGPSLHVEGAVGVDAQEDRLVAVDELAAEIEIVTAGLVERVGEVVADARALLGQDLGRAAVLLANPIAAQQDGGRPVGHPVRPGQRVIRPVDDRLRLPVVARSS